MTEFEMAYLLTDMQAAIANQSALFFTGISGFLVSGWIAAHRLSRALVGVVISMYTLWFCGAVFMLTRMGISLSGLVLEIHKFAASGKGLSWHSAAVAKAPDWVFELGPYPGYLMGVIVYAGTIYFFLYCRRMNRKTESGAWHPKV